MGAGGQERRHNTGSKVTKQTMEPDKPGEENRRRCRQQDQTASEREREKEEDNSGEPANHSKH